MWDDRLSIIPIERKGLTVGDLISSTSKPTPVGDLTGYHKNPRRGSLPLIMESLQTIGQYKPIVVNLGTKTGRPNEVLAGNHTLMAARELGWPLIDATFVDVDEEIARKIVLVDNRSNDVASYDTDELLELLGEVDDLLATGYTDDDIAAMLTPPDLGDGSLSDDDDDEQAAETFSKYALEDLIEESVTHWRQHGFPYRQISIPHGMQMINRLAELPDSTLISTKIGYQLADTYHPHRFDVPVAGMRTPLDSFGDDKQLQRAVRLLLEDRKQLTDTSMNGALTMVAGTQMASNFRPGFALYLYRRYAPVGAVVLDTSTGFGGRLIGFLASECAQYIGVDPNTVTYEANLTMAEDLRASDRVELINLPAEDVPHDLVRGRCDFAFTSPPYFSKEHYSEDDTQSWKRYSTGEAWRDGFLIPMLQLQFAALKAGSINIVNIADVKIGKETYPLLDWTVECGKAVGFELLAVEKFPLRRVPNVSEDVERFEPVIVMRKPQS